MLSESIVALILAASTQLVAAQNPEQSVNGQTGGSLGVNPTVANADITVRGTDWLWAAFAIMLASGVGVLAWGLSRPGESIRASGHFIHAGAYRSLCD